MGRVRDFRPGRSAMADYDDFAETYQRWTDSIWPYTVVELSSFFDVLGPVEGLRVLDVACGEGRITRMLAEQRADSVLGIDVSSEMIARARARGGGAQYDVVDARDDSFEVEPVDVVTAMYLLHYAPTPEDVGRMARLVSRNLKPGGRFVTYTLSPDYDFADPDPRLPGQCGFDYRALDGPHCELLIDDEKVDIWQWSRAVHETALANAGLADITWHPLSAPTSRPDVAERLDWYLARPSCIVLSAVKALA